MKGNWVSLWGDYSFSENGKKVSFPFQYTARVTDGKIDTDRVYYDRMYIMQTLGYKVTPPEKLNNKKSYKPPATNNNAKGSELNHSSCI